MENYNKNYIENVFTNISEGIIFLNSEEKIIYLNKFAEDIIKWPFKSAIDKYYSNIYQIKKTKFNSQRIDTFTEAIKSKEPYICKESFMIITRTGVEVEVLHRLIPVFDQTNDFIGSIIIFQDFTEKRKYETALQNSFRLRSLGSLSSGMAHDFNNILTTILGNISLAKMDLKPDDGIFELLNDAEDGIEKARAITNQLLTFASNDISKKEVLNVSELLHNFISFTLSGSNVTSNFYFPINLWDIKVNRSQISQVLNNIVLHSVQSMPIGGNIEITAQNISVPTNNDYNLKVGKYILINIQDQGIGISDNDLKHIFDPFYISDISGKDIGLAVIKEILREHNGNVFIKSKVGEGTTFSIYLPAIKPKVSKIKSKIHEIGIPRKTVKVLIMDDEDIIRRVLSKMLTQLGYEVYAVKEGNEAINIYQEYIDKKEPFNAVILDLTIRGGMGGKETMENLLKIDPSVKVLASSGYTNDRIILYYKEYGFSGTLLKPYRVKELDNKLIEILKND